MLDFDHVIDKVKSFATSYLGRELVGAIRPVPDAGQITHSWELMREGLELHRLNISVPLAELPNVEDALERAELESILGTSELYGICLVLKLVRAIKLGLNDLDQGAFPYIYSLVGDLDDLKIVGDELSRCIDQDYQVLDAASGELYRLRRKIATLRDQSQERLQQLLRDPGRNKMLQDQLITQRHGRYVLPVKSEYRGEFGGIVHDRSSSGATLFIEPKEIWEINNKLQELGYEEEREIARILSQLTSLVTPEVDMIRSNLKIIGELDLIMSKVYFAHATRSIVPELSVSRDMYLKKARHPLIDPKTVMPNDIALSGQQRALIITGPNTGGKTVLLKMMGLLVLMAQSGIPIPVDEGSYLPIYSGVYADIGDEQSIEHSLSTFSSHMTRIVELLDCVDQHSLVLLDELGVGTDPTEGSALALALVEHLLNKKCLSVITTHYNELKSFAYTDDRALNASVAFDIERLAPTYKLLLGVPGQSNAFAISRRLGLSEQILAKANEHLHESALRTEEMVVAIHKERDELEQELSEQRSLRKQLAQELEQFKEQQSRLLEEAAEKAHQEAAFLVKKAQQSVDQVLVDLRSNQHKKEHQLLKIKKDLEEQIPDRPVKKQKQIDQAELDLNIGDEVVVRDFAGTAVICDINRAANMIQVQIGHLKMKIKKEQICEVKKEKPQAHRGVYLSRSNLDVKPELHLRGMLVEDALQELDKYLDNVMLSGYKQVTIVHGKGTGAVKKAVHQFLGKHRGVNSFRLGHANEGSFGVTVVELK